MNIICTILGHNWTRQTTEDGSGKWQKCVRCGKEQAVPNYLEGA